MRSNRELLTESADYDTPGSWDIASVGWPEWHDPEMKIRIFVIANKNIVPYGAYVTVGNKLRIHPDYADKLRDVLIKLENNHDHSTDR